MNRSQAFFAVILVIAGIYLVASQGKSSSNKAAVTIGISQITSHPVWDEVKKGLLEGLAEGGYKEGQNLTIDFQNAQGESSVNQQIAQKFASSDYNLFIPFGTPSSQALVNVIKEKPIVFAGVTDPVTAGLVKSNDKPDGNATGTSDVTLYKEQLELLKKLKPDVRKVGIVYSPGEANARFGLEQAKKYAGPLNLEIITAPANDSREILTSAQSLADRVDAFYILPDNAILAGQEAIIKVALEAKKPLITLDQSGVEKGGYATLGTNYEKVGQRTAEIVLKVLKGEKPADIPVIGVTDADLFINTKTADAIGLAFKDEIKKQAKQIYQ